MPTFTTRLRRALALAACFVTVASAAPSVGRAPAFTLSALDGRTVSSASFKGHVVLVNFWATWCGPCRQEMPALDRLDRQYAHAGLTMVGISVDTGPGPVKALLARFPVHYTILLDADTRVSTAYHVETMPSTFIIDRHGVVRYVHHGYRPGDERAYATWIRRLLRE